MHNVHGKRSSAALVTRETRRALRYHFTPTRMAIYKRQTTVSFDKDGEKLKLS